jgi:hypothetical protein
MPDLPRIPRSPSVQWRRFRAKAVPLVVFFLAAGASAWLWTDVGGTISAVGRVESTRVDVTSPAVAKVVDLPSHSGGQWSLYENIRAGDVIAVLEDERESPAKVIEVRAPISGTLVGVHCWPGQNVLPGVPIATIAADYGKHLVGFMPEDAHFVARPGMHVTLRPRTASGDAYTSEVEVVANHIEPLPRHLWGMSSEPQWGVPFRVKMPPDVILLPGSLVDLHFDASTVD